MTEKNEAARALGRLGGLARMKWTPAQRAEAARKAVNARWERARRESDTKQNPPDTK